MLHIGLLSPHLTQLLFLLLFKCIHFNTILKLVFMGKQASEEQIARWRRDYKALRKKVLNRDIAEKIRKDAANLSSCGNGKKKPGKELIDIFYRAYPELLESSQYQQADSNENEGQQGYQQAYESAIPMNERQYYQAEFSKVTSANLIAVKACNTMAESNLILSRVIASYQNQAPGSGN